MPWAGLRGAMKVLPGPPWKPQCKAKNSSIFEIRFLKKSSDANKSKQKSFEKHQHNIRVNFSRSQTSSIALHLLVYIYASNYISYFSPHFLSRGSIYSSLLSHRSQLIQMFNKILIQQILVECKIVLCAVFCDIREFFELPERWVTIYICVS